ncbi:MAG: lamin tail domain-containing protein [Paludibacteraceae bacterium]|nr:lamin tail domain-containing protein [Paludibacteraceae bacterium]
MRTFVIGLLIVFCPFALLAQREGLSRFERIFTTDADFGTAEKVQEGDVIFNELMPFVTEGRSKFVELLNNSPRIIDLKTLNIANIDEEGVISKVKKVSDTTLLLSPGQYVVLAPDTDAINCPAGRNSESLYLKNALPLFSSTTTSLVLFDEDTLIIDKIVYSLKWHTPDIEDIHNVSLERINPNGETQDSLNWHSAASTVGYQTAGFENSQMLKKGVSGGKRFWLEENIFSPDNDGFQDYLKIGYNLPKEGYLLTVRIYTRSGSLVCTPFSNFLVPQSGVLTYNGTFEGNSAMIETGLYVMRVEGHHRSGKKYIENLVFIKAK